MNENELYRSLSDKTLPVYFLYGDERYSIEKAIQYAKNSLNPNFRDLNFTVIDTEYSTDIDMIVSCFESIPFMDSKRVIVVKNSDLFQTGSKTYTKEQLQKLINYLNSPCQTTVVVFAPSQVDGRSELFKFMKKNYDIHRFDRLDRSKFSLWVSNRLKSKNLNMDNMSKNEFIEKSGYLYKDSKITLLDVENEIEKIRLKNLNQDVISIENIQNIGSTVINDSDIYTFIDYLFSGNSKNAYHMLHSLINRQKQSMRILSLLSRQVSILIKIYFLNKERCSQDTISKLCNIPAFTIRKFDSQLKRYSYHELLELYNLCSDMDYRIKKGQIRENVGVEVIVNKICKNRR